MAKNFATYSFTNSTFDESLNTEKSAILSSPSENRLVSVISYQPVVDLIGGSTNGLSTVDELGSLIQDLNQCSAAAAAPAGLLLVSLALKSIFGNISGVGVSQVVVSSVLDSSSSPLEVVRSGKKKKDISGVYFYDDFQFVPNGTNNLVLSILANITYRLFSIHGR